MRVSVNLKSGNSKTGPIPVSMTERDSCPTSCPLYTNGCYAENFRVKRGWDEVANEGLEWQLFTKQVEALKPLQLWRHNVAGDLPHTQGRIRKRELNALVRANRGRRGFTYTHHELTKHNVEAITKANDNGFTINVSTNNIAQAMDVYKTGLPVVVLLPTDAPNVQNIEGVKVIACPAEKSDKVQCVNCELCAYQNRDYVIGFRAHGARKKQVNIIARG